MKHKGENKQSQALGSRRFHERLKRPAVVLSNEPRVLDFAYHLFNQITYQLKFIPYFYYSERLSKILGPVRQT